MDSFYSSQRANCGMLSVEKVLQSDSDWLFGLGMNMMFMHNPLPQGAHGLGAYHILAKKSDFLHRKHSLVRIRVDEYGMFSSCFGGGCGICRRSSSFEFFGSS